MLEELLSIKAIRQRPSYGLLLGACYAAIAIGLALWLFPDDPALIAVALITLMFYPTLTSFLKSGEDIEARKKELNPFTFFHDHFPLYKLYLGFFLGVFLVFSLFSLSLPALAANYLFRNQMSLFLGAASWNQGLFTDLFLNNLLVLLVIFLTAFFLGEGGILLITWNASVWGTIFGSLARNAGLAILLHHPRHHPAAYAPRGLWLFHVRHQRRGDLERAPEGEDGKREIPADSQKPPGGPGHCRRVRRARRDRRDLCSAECHDVSDAYSI